MLTNTDVGNVGSRGLRVLKCYMSLVRSILRHFASCFEGFLSVQCPSLLLQGLQRGPGSYVLPELALPGPFNGSRYAHASTMCFIRALWWGLGSLGQVVRLSCGYKGGWQNLKLSCNRPGATPTVPKNLGEG